MSIHRYPEDMQNEIIKLALDYPISFEDAEKYYLMGGYQHAKNLLDIQTESNFEIPFDVIPIYSNLILMGKWKSVSDELMEYVVDKSVFRKVVEWMIAWVNKFLSTWFDAKATYYDEIAKSVTDKNSFLHRKYELLRDYNLYVSNHYACEANVGKMDKK